jgi:hypothetical protein
MLIHNSWDGYAAIKSPFVMGEGGCKKIYLNVVCTGQYYERRHSSADSKDCFHGRWFNDNRVWYLG